MFHLFVFQKLVKKHSGRIRGFEEDKKHIWHFFDKKGYIIMAIMMGGGIALRASGILPEWFIAFFYTGLGLALTVAGISFIVSYIRGGHGEVARALLSTSSVRHAAPAASCRIHALRAARGATPGAMRVRRLGKRGARGSCRSSASISPT